MIFIIEIKQGMTLTDSVNRDEALRCLKLARSALVEGNKAKAKRLAEKSRQMCRTDEGDGKVWEPSVGTFYRHHVLDLPYARVFAKSG